MAKMCQGPECIREAYAKNLCLAHYKQQHKGQTLRVLRGEVVFEGFEKPPPYSKQCWWKGCGLQASGRGLCAKHHTYLNKRGGPFPVAPIKRHRLSNINEEELTADCEKCGGSVEIARHVKRDKVWVCASVRVVSVDEYIRRRVGKYGLTVEEFHSMLEKQDYTCPICKRSLDESKLKGTAVDHCHTTGRVRGILHSTCNMGLGQFEDNPQFLRAAADYLERFLVE